MGFSSESKEADQFRQGLLNAGLSEGRDVVIEWQYTNGDYDRVSALAADLVQRKVDVIVVESTVAAQAVQRATSTIPIVMALVADPVGSGLVASLGHPGGNVTGLSLMTTELGVKRLQLLKETIPLLTRITVLRNPDTPWPKRNLKHAKRLRLTRMYGSGAASASWVRIIIAYEDRQPQSTHEDSGSYC